ncbi:GUN4 domain-containing protein [Pseudanabaena sp. FACHB-2040]|uniref:GUN4 domain-containing protein n=1 Tax=Pseudanabaena sp. FACHB-2040 TaxID=2692859 RepID=UPI00168901BE|nr:GUN4 domain-containing protein [Pseudanabaena sp. FACHB-2040]MBD2259444.1 GUN4 domain-containing protein [Pseudanabaena sp. FACHB-2040]
MKRSFLAFLLLGMILVTSLSWLTAPQTQRAVAQTQPIPSLFQAPAADISTLQAQLKAQNWQAADAETRRILEVYVHPNGDLFSSPLATNIPPEVLQTLDRLWSEASGGRFGFSAQKAIWDQARAQHPNNTDTAAKAFGDRVGWTRPTRDPDNFVAPDWLTELELNYSLQAPVGHLPWAGISWERINNILTAQGCGSCSTDALYLQGERFNRHLPVLFNWLTTALEAPIPAVGSWERPRLAHTINIQGLYPNNTCPVYTLAQAISPDSTVLAVSSYSYERSCSGGPENSALALWNAQRGTRIVTLLRGRAIEGFSYSGQPQEPSSESDRIVGDVANAIAFTPDGRQVAAGLSNGTVRLWTTERGEAVRTLSGHRYAVRAIAISADGRTLASASADQTLKLWNLQTGQLLRTIALDPNDGIPLTLLISPDGQRLATATNRNTLQLWNAQTGQLVRTFVDEAVNLPPDMPIAFSPDGQKLATADIDYSIKLWNANTGARLITLKGHSQRVQHLAFSPDSQRLVSSQDKTAYLWNLQTNQSIRTFELVQSVGHPVQLNNLGYVAFSPDGKVLATSTLLQPPAQSEPIPQQGVTVWDPATGQPLVQIHNVAQFQFSPNSQVLVARGQAVQIWQPYSSRVGG